MKSPAARPPFSYLQLHNIDDTVHIENVQSVEKERRLLLPRRGARRGTSEELPDGRRGKEDRGLGGGGKQKTKQKRERQRQEEKGATRSASPSPTDSAWQGRGLWRAITRRNNRKAGRTSKSDVSRDEAARVFGFFPLLLQRGEIDKRPQPPFSRSGYPPSAATPARAGEVRKRRCCRRSASSQGYFFIYIR